MLFLAIFFTLFGGIITLLGQAYLIYKYFWKNEETIEDEDEKIDYPKFVFCKLPPNLLKAIDSAEWKGQSESCLALNLLFQFLFREWKDTIEMRRWVMKKLSAEFLEMQRTATGRLLDKITVRDLQLGGDLPIIKYIEIQSLALNESRETIETLDLCLELAYEGKFQLAVDVDLVLGRSASLSVSVTKLQGKGRLQLIRKPFSHWSFAFYEEPTVEFLIESQFQGRQLPQIKSLIINQIRRALRKKHTLPNYKIRFRPFLPFPSFPIPHEAASNDPVEVTNIANVLENIEITKNSLNGGVLEATVLNCSRLQLVHGANKIFCSLSLDSKSWVGGTSSRDSYSYHRLEIERVKKRPLGLTFKQQFVEERCQNCVIIDSVLPNSPASKAGFLKNDVVVAAEGITISNTKQLVKTLKMADNRFYISVERKIDLLNTESPKEETPLFDDTPKDENGANIESIKNSISFTNFSSENTRKTGSVIALENPYWNERILFDLNSECLCLNIGVWCQTAPSGKPQSDSPVKSPSNDDSSSVCDVLIGHASVSLLSLVKECSSTTQGSHLEVFRLIPPNSWQLDRKWQKLSLHRGFDWRLCCGDITLYFRYFNTQARPPNPKIRGRMNEALQKANAKFSLKIAPEDKTAKEKDKNQPIRKLSLTSSSPVHLLKPETNTASRSATDSEDDVSQNSSNSSRESSHDFVSAHFNSTATCDFCQKKIWLKAAFQCSLCGKISHKKCVNKCKLETSCEKDKARKSILNLTKNSAGIAESSKETSQGTPGKARKSFDSISPISCRKNLNALLSNIAQTAQRHQTNPTSPDQPKITSSPVNSGLSRSGSSCNLALPNSSCFPASKSLPPSPYHSPSQSRKSSLQGSADNPEISSWLDLLLSHEDSRTDDESEIEDDDDIDGTLNEMMKFPHDDSLLALAKEKGKELYGKMTFKRRRNKLERMLSKLQEAVDRETSVRNRLAKEEQKSQNISEKTKLAFLLAKCDQRNQALATLMLLYLSAMQHCRDDKNNEEEIEKGTEPLSDKTCIEEKENTTNNIQQQSIPLPPLPTSCVVALCKEAHTLALTPAAFISVTAPSPVSELNIFPSGDGNLFKGDQDNIQMEDENSCVIRDPDEIQLGLLVSNAEEPTILDNEKCN